MSAPKGHNSKVKAGSVSGDRLKSFIERIEKLIEERKAIGGDIRDVFSEAKGIGYDVRTMRKIILVRAVSDTDRAETEALLDVYMHALGMETSANVIEPTEEELEERAGRIIHEVDRCMALAIDGKPPKIEAIKELIDCSAGKAHKLRTFVAERLSSSNPVHRENEKETPGAVPAGSGTGTAEVTSSLASAVANEGCLSGRVLKSDEQEAPAARDQLPSRAERSAEGNRGIGLRENGSLTESCGDGLTVGGVADSAPPVPRADATAPPQEPTPVVEGEASKSLYQRITGAFADIPREPRKATEAKANHPPQGAASVAAGDDWPVMPAALRRVQA